MSDSRTYRPRPSPSVLLALAVVLAGAGCEFIDPAPPPPGASIAGPAGAESATRPNAWSPRFTPPRTLETDRVHLEPLTPDHAALDHAAFMSSRDHLHQTLHWGSWPRADMTVEENRRDLERHEHEFSDRSAYAYTVLRPDRTACLGCVYLDPVDGDPNAVALALWVVEPGVRSGLDEHLLRAVLRWIRVDWPFTSVTWMVHVDDARGMEIAEAAGMTKVAGEDEAHVGCVWER